MILPKHILDQIDWYEASFHSGWDRPYEKVVLHWKQWYKPRKVLKFERIRGDDAYIASGEFLELHWQLIKHFSEGE